LGISIGRFRDDIVGLFVGRMRKVRAKSGDRLAGSVVVRSGIESRATSVAISVEPVRCCRTSPKSATDSSWIDLRGPNITSARLLRGDRWYSFLPTW